MEVAGSNYRRYFCSFLVKSDIFKYETAQTVQSQNLIALYLETTQVLYIATIGWELNYASDFCIFFLNERLLQFF